MSFLNCFSDYQMENEIPQSNVVCVAIKEDANFRCDEFTLTSL